MNTSRAKHATRLVAALVVLWSLLFMQLAVAAYACPHASPASTGRSTSDLALSTTGCAPLDAAQPGLCRVQADVAKQTVDTSHDLDRPMVPGPARVFPIPRAETAQVGFLTLVTTELHRVTSPALSIRYCRFRN